MSSTSSATSLLTTLFIILVPLSLLLLLLQDKRNSRGHPPCPPRLPLIGNLHQLGPLPHRSLHALSQQHGPLMLLRLGQVPALVVSSPDAAREVLRNQDHACASRPALKPARILVYGCKDLAFAPYGDYWKQLRKICSVHLLSPKRVQSYRLMREDEVESMMGKISSQASASANVIDLSEVLYSFANDVLCRVVSGKFTREEGRNRLFSELAGENSVLLSKIYVGDYFPWLGWLDMFFGSVARCNKNKARWDKLLDEVIKEHAVRSAQHGGEENDGEEKDFVDVLLSLQKDAAMDFVLTTEDIKALLELSSGHAQHPRRSQSSTQSSSQTVATSRSSHPPSYSSFSCWIRCSLDIFMCDSCRCMVYTANHPGKSFAYSQAQSSIQAYGDKIRGKYYL
nr:PREDICTED: cytochrome P450 71A1-like [Musa acuminata subsp. malaccensis]